LNSQKPKSLTMTLERPMFPPRRAVAEAADTARGVAPARRRRSPPVVLPAGVDDFPDVYVLSLEGDCLQPAIRDGASVVIQKSTAYAAGDIVCIWFRPEFGETVPWLKRLRMAIPPWVTFPYQDATGGDCRAVAVFEQLNPVRQYVVPCSQIHAIHKVIGVAPPAENSSISMRDVCEIVYEPEPRVLPGFLSSVVAEG
jgi:hypothetical protein